MTTASATITSATAAVITIAVAAITIVTVAVVAAAGCQEPLGASTHDPAAPS